ncbi:hypothetical protein PPSIR1_05971 [Plesiocystis pacifica SIR-1]|uniref:Uncharacterized protein n=1 Tax=Plesiocystis pacifica SIR-1 TaxID=391625 RepID=A6G6R9_9BACT|nr:hypothetical protein [Plesiocystis pacifica]EDM78372.1 hypothetical protein PPSIR1_05971 [Plesiocystis pacifica SIR-1]
MFRFPTELVGEHLVSEAAVFFTEALAKLNARQFIREAPEDSPCCARCAGCELDTDSALQDAKRLLETRVGHPVSIVAYSMGRELSQGVACRPVLVEGDRLAYQREDGSIVDPVSKFEAPEESCCCGRHDDAEEHG